MHSATRFDTELVAAARARARALDAEDRFLRWTKAITPNHISLMHVADVEEDDPRYLKLKQWLVTHAPTKKGAWPVDWDRLHTQMGDKAPLHIVPHGGAPEVEKPLSASQTALIDRVTKELYQEYVFTGFTGTKEADMSIGEWSRDLPSRVAMLPKWNKLMDSGVVHKRLDLKQGRAHRALMVQDDVWILPKAIERRQPNKRKVRQEQVASRDGLTDIPFANARLGDPWLYVRYRTPQGAAGAFNIPGAVMSAGMVKPSERRFARLLKHRSEQDTALKLTTFLKSRAADSKRWRLLEFDVTGMEKFTPARSGQAVLERFDELVGARHGVMRLMHNVPVVAPSGNAGDFLISTRSWDYDYDSLLGYGTASGLWTVVPQNQVAALAAILEIFAMAGVPVSTVAGCNGDGDSPLLVLSKTDDNLLATADERIFKALAGKTFTVLGRMTISFESAPNADPGVAAGFLATRYEIDSKKHEVSAAKDMAGGLLNLFCSEAGIALDAASKQWRRNSPKGDKTVSVGTGMVLRMQSYLINESDGLELWATIEEALASTLRLRWWQAFPTTSRELREVNRAVTAADSVSALRWLMEVRPDLIHKARLSREELPEELLKSLYFYVSPADFRGLFGNELSTAEPGTIQAEEALHALAPNLPRFQAFLAARISELERAGL